MLCRYWVGVDTIVRRVSEEIVDYVVLIDVYNVGSRELLAQNRELLSKLCVVEFHCVIV